MANLKNAKCKIGDWEFTPQGLELTVAAVDYESGRSASGNMKRNMLGTCYTYKVTMPPSNTDAVRAGLRELLDAYQTCTFFDPIAGGNRTATYYVGDRTAPVYNYTLDLWDSWSFTMIEKTPRKASAVKATL